MGYEGYRALARVYDLLNAEIDYSAWGDFIEESFARYLEKKPELVLDLACGTGRMTATLAARGYDMIGIDGSGEMLSEAYMRAGATSGILFSQQDMRSFELYGTVGAVVCCLDSLNYLLDEDDLKSCFFCVHNYLDPDGLFLFDMNTPYKFENIYKDCSYILEADTPDHRAVFCGWQNDYRKKTKLCDFDLSIFEEDPDGKYQRFDEHQTERCYSLDEIENLLGDCGFELLGIFSDYRFSAPGKECERWYFAARAKK